jgi:hypothetical protein
MTRTHRQPLMGPSADTHDGWRYARRLARDIADREQPAGRRCNGGRCAPWGGGISLSVALTMELRLPFGSLERWRERCQRAPKQLG